MSTVHHTTRPKSKATRPVPDLSTGTQILANAMTMFLFAPSKPTPKPANSYLKAAVCSLMQFVPKEEFLAMLRQLTKEADEIQPKDFDKLSWAAVVKEFDLLNLSAGGKDSKARLFAAEAKISKVQLSEAVIFHREVTVPVEPNAQELPAANVQPAAPDTKAVSTEDFMTDMRRQEKELRLADIAAKRLIPGLEMRERLGVTPQALSAALKAKRMFIMQGPAGEYLYPAFFADPKYDRPVLEKVCKVLGDMPGGSKWDFFMSPKISLGNRTPLEALLKGKLDLVMVAATGFAEQ